MSVTRARQQAVDQTLDYQRAKRALDVFYHRDSGRLLTVEVETMNRALRASTPEEAVAIWLCSLARFATRGDVLRMKVARAEAMKVGIEQPAEVEPWQLM